MWQIRIYEIIKALSGRVIVAWYIFKTSWGGAKKDKNCLSFLLLWSPFQRAQRFDEGIKDSEPETFSCGQCAAFYEARLG